jgi:antitoxin ParD1/3/4
MRASSEYHIRLPGKLGEFVKKQLDNGEFRDANEYFAALVEADQIGSNKERLAKLVEEGLASGPATPMTADDWKNLRQRVKTRLAQRKPRPKK